MTWIRGWTLGVSLLVTLWVSGCPSSNCASEGSCASGAPCTNSSECVDRLCAPLTSGGGSVCLAPCGPAEPCPSGQMCSAIGSGSFCESTTSTGRDAGADAPVAPDAGPVDADSDGVPSAMDCDDSNPSVGATSERACESMCGPGVEQCTAGAWAACSTPTDCTCTMDGATRAAACGNCGNEMQTCTSGLWTATSSCLDQGCMPGTVEVEDKGFCFIRERICNSMCEWSDWTVTHPFGDCDPPGGCYDGMRCDSECRIVAGASC